ncbi:HAD family hydrolase [Thiohalospira sp.]|uniref:histidinol-phosphatase n=1 Tax=Thiohalospira sp. TaxID=3080549 RepID=UPI00397FCDAC
MALALFDLDNTLLAGDSDHEWGDFLADRGLVDAEAYRRANDAFYAQYQAGTLDIFAFLRFALEPLTRYPLDRLLAWRAEFLAERIQPLVLPAGRRLVEEHRAAGDTPVIITATHSFVTAPIAELFGVDALIATEPEFVDGRYTGEVAGTPCFREGKVTRLQAWLSDAGETLAGSHFYSDSRNDLPLLEQVTHPVAVDPDPALAETARSRNWPVQTLRAGDRLRPLDEAG